MRSILAILLCYQSYLFTDETNLIEEAKLASQTLHAFEFSKAFMHYSEIISECTEETSLEFQYWIYRHRSIAAALLSDWATVYHDELILKSIIEKLNLPSDAIDEYCYSLNQLLEAVDKSSDLTLIPCGGVWHCIKKGGSYISSGTKVFYNDAKEEIRSLRNNIEEAFYRATCNEEELQKFLIQKATEKYAYPYLAHSSQEMEMLAKDIESIDLYLGDRFITHLRKNPSDAIKLGIALTTLANAKFSTLKDKATTAGSGAGALYETYEIFLKIGVIDDYRNYFQLQQQLNRMEIDNQVASKERYTIFPINPDVRFIEQRSIWYNDYLMLDVNNKEITFKLPIVKPF